MINVISNEINSLFQKDLIINYERETYHVKTTDLQKNQDLNNETTIYLEDCEKKLREVYNMSDDEELIIYKMDYYLKEALIPITEYQLFSSINGKKMDLEMCQGINIYITIPVNINQNELYKYNPYSEYYNNSCYPEMSLIDCQNKKISNKRKIEFNKNNFSLCEKNCIYVIITFL